eukprot:TRINITY_DN10735_c0_g1_i2.p1 TRINITY_DN10735_c0_g1~~TRINITY_DN10735_c0_g1_i2.p1  ORF type:complete len:299 (-),score=121.35 TRINITY_DN10735_c0_g1_i2:10-906(-)
MCIRDRNELKRLTKSPGLDLLPNSEILPELEEATPTALRKYDSIQPISKAEKEMKTTRKSFDPRITLKPLTSNEEARNTSQGKEQPQPLPKKKPLRTAKMEVNPGSTSQAEQEKNDIPQSKKDNFMIKDKSASRFEKGKKTKDVKQTTQAEPKAEERVEEKVEERAAAVEEPQEEANAEKVGENEEEPREREEGAVENEVQNEDGGEKKEEGEANEEGQEPEANNNFGELNEEVHGEENQPQEELPQNEEGNAEQEQQQQDQEPEEEQEQKPAEDEDCLLYTSPSPRDRQKSRMPSSA